MKGNGSRHGDQWDPWWAFNCSSGACNSGPFPFDSTVTLTASTGYKAPPFPVGAVTRDCADGQVTVTENGVNCTATFELLPYTLSVVKQDGRGLIKGGQRAIDCGRSARTVICTGTDVTLTATPDEGFSLITGAFPVAAPPRRRRYA